MSWEPIHRRDARPDDAAPRITIAAAVMGHHRHMQACITWRAAPEWFAKGQPVSINIGRNEHAGLLRIERGGRLVAATVPTPGKRKIHVGQVRIGAWPEIAEGKYPSTECSFEMDGDAAVLTLPKWALGLEGPPPSTAVTRTRRKAAPVVPVPVLVPEPVRVLPTPGAATQPIGSPGATLWKSWPEIKQLAIADGQILGSPHELQGYNRYRERHGKPPLFLRAASVAGVR